MADTNFMQFPVFCLKDTSGEQSSLLTANFYHHHHDNVTLQFARGLFPQKACGSWSATFSRRIMAQWKIHPFSTEP